MWAENPLSNSRQAGTNVLLMFLFGVFRHGALSEFFPSSSLQGMLAAIGVGILAKQVHVMLGVTSISGAPLDILAQVPS